MKSRGNKQSNRKGPGYRTPAGFRYRQALKISANRSINAKNILPNSHLTKLGK